MTKQQILLVKLKIKILIGSVTLFMFHAWKICQILCVFVCTHLYNFCLSFHVTQAQLLTLGKYNMAWILYRANEIQWNIIFINPHVSLIQDLTCTLHHKHMHYHKDKVESF